jgi:glycosyltransferase involved in cell wall biosynthesis
MMRPARLKFIVVFPGIVGPQLDLESDIRLLMALARRGHDVTCFVAKTQESRLPAGNVPGFNLETTSLRKVVPIQSFVLLELLAFWRIVRSIGRCDVMILSAYSIPAALPYLVIARLFRRRPAVFLRIPSNPVETGGPVRTLVFTCVYAVSIKLSAAFLDKVFFISPMLARSYSANLKIPLKKTAVWPSPVEMRIFRPVCAPRVERLRNELGLSGRLAVIYHGAITRGRGIVETVKAFGILKEESERVKLVLLGDGPLRREIELYVRANRLEDFVKVCGPVDYLDVPLYLAACDVGIVPLPDHPWWRYQCPTKVLECLAMNMPLIVSDIPCHRWILDRAPVATFLDGTSPRQIANGVLSYLGSKKNLDPKRGREVARAFSSTRLAKFLESETLFAITRK